MLYHRFAVSGLASPDLVLVESTAPCPNARIARSRSKEAGVVSCAAHDQFRACGAGTTKYEAAKPKVLKTSGTSEAN